MHMHMLCISTVVALENTSHTQRKAVNFAVSQYLVHVRHLATHSVSQAYFIV